MNLLQSRLVQEMYKQQQQTYQQHTINYRWHWQYCGALVWWFFSARYWLVHWGRKFYANLLKVNIQCELHLCACNGSLNTRYWHRESLFITAHFSNVWKVIWPDKKSKWILKKSSRMTAEVVDARTLFMLWTWAHSPLKFFLLWTSPSHSTKHYKTQGVY